MRKPADKGRRGQKLENLTDVLYGWPLAQKLQLLTNETSTITIFTSIINYIIYNRIEVDPNISGDE